MSAGKLFVVSGPSGAGKGTICSELLKDDCYALSISMTTRAPRNNEIPGVSYYFVSHEEFQKTIDEDGFLEHAEIYGNCYGTPKKPVLENMNNGKDVILEIEMNGAMQVKKSYPEAVLIFVLPPSLEVLRNRLAGRGTETPEQIQTRSSRCMEEIRKIVDYDYFVVNDDLQTAVEDVRCIIKTEHLKVAGNHKELIKKYEEET